MLFSAFLHLFNCVNHQREEQRESCALSCVAGSILPHCSKAVNTFAAACQAAVKYCLCSVWPHLQAAENSSENSTSHVRLCISRINRKTVIIFRYMRRLYSILELAQDLGFDKARGRGLQKETLLHMKTHFCFHTYFYLQYIYICI